MSKRLVGKTVVIAGAAGGQGRAGAVLFAREGANLALTDVNEEGLQETVDLVAAESPDVKVFAQPVDMRNLPTIESFVGAVEGEFDGVIDVVYINSGLNHIQSIEDATEEDWDRIHDINLKSHFFLVKYALPALKRSGYASVINVSSGAAYVAPANGNSMYCSSKGAVVSLTKAQARDLAQYGIRVNCILPGATETPMVRRFFAAMPPEERAAKEQEVLGRTMLGRLGQPEEVAAMAVFLALPEASYMTASIVHVDAGYTST